MDGPEAIPPAPEFGSPPQYPIESVDNALKVLLLIGERPTIRLTEVSQYLGVASSTAHRLLAMLVFRGFVRQEAASRSYVDGPSLDNLALGVLRRLDVRTRARPVLEQLNADLQETVHLGRLEGGDVHFIDSIESTRALRVANRLGRSLPAHASSTGKALLATLTDAEVSRLYPHEELVQLTARSVATRTQLLTELAAIRERGYATSEEESEEGVSSLAVAVHAARSPRLAVNASLPVSRMAGQTRSAVLARVRAAAAELDQLLV